MELSLFPNDYDNDNNPQKHIETQDGKKAILIKVRPKDYVQQQEKITQQQTDLIFAFENIDEEQQKHQQFDINQQKLKVQDYQTIQTILDQGTQINSTLKSPEAQLDTLIHKHLFVIQRILFFPQKFYLYDNDKNFLLCARKKLIQVNSMFYFFNDINMESTKNESYLGYMTFESAYQYTLYSADDTPLAQFKYNIKKKAPCEITIRIINKQQRVENKKSNKKSLRVFNLQNRIPSKNIITGKYSTCLEGLGKVASAKNCAIVFQQQSSLIMAKQKQKHYNLHYGEPWSHFIAFAFAISNYEEKDFQQ